jgi:regulator of replication initiation timing
MPATWMQEPASYPPPGWTRTPLYLELCAMKQHVASLTDDNIQLRGTVTDLRESVSQLGSEVGKMKRAFGALSNLVDAEVDSCRGESSKLWLEVTQARESGVLTQQALDKLEHSLLARVRGSDEWTERAVIELRGEVERRWQSWVDDSRQRTLEMQRCAGWGVHLCFTSVGGGVDLGREVKMG